MAEEINGVFCRIKIIELKKTFFFLLLIISICVNAKTYYVSPSGNDANPGTKAKPFLTLERLNSLLNPGDLVYLRNGLYKCGKSATAESQIYLSGINGKINDTIKIWAYPGEKPVLDFSNILAIVSSTGLDISNCSYLHIKGIRITNMPQNKNGNSTANCHIYECNNIVFENCESDHGFTGFACENSDNVTYINCDAHDMENPYDPNGYAYGGADGFSRTGDHNTSTNTVYRGCRAWWCSDDGWDCFNTNGTIIYDGCWAFWNGYIPGTTRPAGDGNGFKLGGEKTDVTTTITRYVRNCIAFQNRFNGFTQNAGNFIGQLYNNTAYGNVVNGFKMGFGALPQILKNNIAYRNGINEDHTNSWIQSNNSWNGIRVTDADFLWLKPTGVAGPRRVDGSLPDLQFLTLSPSSKLIDAGADVGVLYKGKAPDLGAHELQ